MKQDDIQMLKKEIRFRARRGWKETDLWLGGFVEKHLDGLDVKDLTELKALLLETDADLYAWLSGEKQVPKAMNTPLFQRIQTSIKVAA